MTPARHSSNKFDTEINVKEIEVVGMICRYTTHHQMNNANDFLFFFVF